MRGEVFYFLDLFNVFFFEVKGFLGYFWLLDLIKNQEQKIDLYSFLNVFTLGGI